MFTRGAFFAGVLSLGKGILRGYFRQGVFFLGGGGVNASKGYFLQGGIFRGEGKRLKPFKKIFLFKLPS